MARTKKMGPKMTRERAAHVKYLLTHSDLNHAQIASEVGGINQGRVSEIKNGKRFSDVSPDEFRGAV